eukprot:10252053-Karenia_brevis.AAC.1
MGVSSSSLLAQRRAVVAAVTGGGAGDLDVTLALADAGGRAKVDPAFHAHVSPIEAWAEAI